MRMHGRASVPALALGTALVFGLAPQARAQSFTQSAFVQFELSACRNNGDITLPNASQLFVCPDASYTTGNLGKGWNELDLVPHRLTTSLGRQQTATTHYNVLVAADYMLAGKKGYDVIGAQGAGGTAPLINALLSDASCQVSWGPMLEATGVTGGVDTVKYRVLEIQQNKGTTCVFDYYQRLALGAHLYSGSSLQSYMFESIDFQTGKRTLSIPVNEILPQELSKDMTATQDTDYTWNITKTAPAVANFGDTCAVGAPLEKTVTIHVEWQILPGTPGTVKVVTNIYATNPAARVITVNVSDEIRSGTTSLDTAASGAVDVAANTKQLVLTHSYDAPANATDLNDVATATYTDKVTGIAVPGQTQATASASIQPGTQTNTTATIADSESITGSGLDFKVTGTTGASGSFSGYTLNNYTTGPVDWLSAQQSGNGSVDFSKTIRLAAPQSTTGALNDAAVLTGSDGFTANGQASVAIQADALVTLTIDKTIPNILTGSETVTFSFEVRDGANALVASPTITFAAGETAKSAQVGGLQPGAYTVTEAPLAGWENQDPQSAAINLPSCAGAVTFPNVVKQAKAQVTKVTNPAGFEAGWTFELRDAQNNLLETVTSTGASYTAFTTPLGQGSYTITEVAQNGWTNNGPTGDCSFTVNLPADADKTFSCQFTNTYNPAVDLTKTAGTYSKAGDTVTYTFVSKNNSPAGGPSLDCTLSDPLIPSLPVTFALAPGQTDTRTAPYVVPNGAPDPLINTATLSCTDGYSTASDTSSASVDLLHPSFTVTKACKVGTEPISAAGPALFTITFNNTGDAALHVAPSEGAAFEVNAGQSHSYEYSMQGPFAANVTNTVQGTVTLAALYGLPNSYTFTASDECTVAGAASVIKTVSGAAPAAGQTFTFELRQGASALSNGTVLETRTTDSAGAIAFSTMLTPGSTYQICEWVFPGWNTSLAGDAPLFVPNSLIPPALPNPTVNNLTVCADFSVQPAQTRSFSVDNTPPPGGRALTIGFWKNWASCAASNGKGQDPMLDLALGIASASTTNPPGGLVASAQNAGSGWPNYASLWYLVLKGDPTSTEELIKKAPDCSKAVNLLNKSTIDGKKKMASDPLFNMSAQLVAAELNRFMGAGINGDTITNVDKAVLLDGKYKFNGLTYTPKLSAADAGLASCLATQLDNYNNNRTVSACP